MPGKGKQFFSLLITRSVRDILLAIFEEREFQIINTFIASLENDFCHLLNYGIAYC